MAENGTTRMDAGKAAPATKARLRQTGQCQTKKKAVIKWREQNVICVEDRTYLYYVLKNPGTDVMRPLGWVSDGSISRLDLDLRHVVIEQC